MTLENLRKHYDIPSEVTNGIARFISDDWDGLEKKLDKTFFHTVCFQEPWQLIAFYGGQELTKFLNENSNVVKKTDSHGRTMLHYAALGQDINAVKHLIIECQFNPHEPDVFGNNALHYASLGGNAQMISYLNTEFSLDPDLTNGLGMNALHWASRGGNLEAINLLLDRFNMDPAVMTHYGRNALHEACFGGHRGAMEFYIDERQMVTLKPTTNQETLAHLAALSGNLDAFQYAYEKLGKIYIIQNKDDPSLLSYVVKGGCLEILDYITQDESLKSHFQVNADNIVDLNFSAARSHNIDMIEYCTRKAGELNITDFAIIPPGTDVPCYPWDRAVGCRSALEFYFKDNQFGIIGNHKLTQNLLVQMVTTGNYPNLIWLLAYLPPSNRNLLKNTKVLTPLYHIAAQYGQIGMMKCLSNHLNACKTFFLQKQNYFLGLGVLNKLFNCPNKAALSPMVDWFLANQKEQIRIWYSDMIKQLTPPSRLELHSRVGSQRVYEITYDTCSLRHELITKINEGEISKMGEGKIDRQKDLAIMHFTAFFRLYALLNLKKRDEYHKYWTIKFGTLMQALKECKDKNNYATIIQDAVNDSFLGRPIRTDEKLLKHKHPLHEAFIQLGQAPVEMLKQMVPEFLLFLKSRNQYLTDEETAEETKEKGILLALGEATLTYEVVHRHGSC